MAESEGMIGYMGLYENVEDARADFEAIKEAHKQDWIGSYDAALFEKTSEGKVKVLDTDATQRSQGAKVGAITGAIFGVLFPPSMLISAGVGAAVGAGTGNLMKGFMSGDIKAAADELKPGQAGVVLAADATFQAGIDKMMKRAKKTAMGKIDANVEDMQKTLSHA